MRRHSIKHSWRGQRCEPSPKRKRGPCPSPKRKRGICPSPKRQRGQENTARGGGSDPRLRFGLRPLGLPSRVGLFLFPRGEPPNVGPGSLPGDAARRAPQPPPCLPLALRRLACCPG